MLTQQTFTVCTDIDAFIFLYCTNIVFFFSLLRNRVATLLLSAQTYQTHLLLTIYFYIGVMANMHFIFSHFRTLQYLSPKLRNAFSKTAFNQALMPNLIKFSQISQGRLHREDRKAPPEFN